ncbi:DNA repair protein rad-5 [Drechslerella stenobrocha 248]|uniref:DNA repair protein rad-5 n=1 Tax=Drechslerella stenobrocha 248 TaxID=1043628 RepID=W7HYF8_9PEZI|nr:DNA repair protein rad-5 [Drechslerella stenobrocha 248]
MEDNPHPPKRRRFFAQSSPSPPPEESDPVLLSTPQRETDTHLSLDQPIPFPDLDEDDGPDAILDNGVEGEEENADAIDVQALGIRLDAVMLESVVGERLPADVLKRLDDASGGDLERAINMYLDGSWQKAKLPAPSLRTRSPFNSMFGVNEKRKSPAGAAQDPPAPTPASDEETAGRLDRMPEERYIGSFGAEGWATRSGRELLKHGEEVYIERHQPQQIQKIVRRGKGKAVTVVPQAASKRKDIVVRFSNSKGDEVGRLQHETAQFVSTLLDQKICSFKAVCVYAPDVLRTNETIYLQLKCYMLRRTFNPRAITLTDSNRSTGLFEVKETEEEKALRLRQTSLVKLFNEIKLYPTSAGHDSSANREGLLQVAEMAEEKEKEEAAKGVGTPVKDEEEPQEGKELEQDQLDQLYKKAQTFDFNSPEAEPAETFAMELRKYQKQALNWMLNKERDRKNEEQEESMHPLWEEYTWPIKDENDRDLPLVENQEKFYVNPYSGELSLKFPVQEQNCLGGVLADEMGLGKTIEMLSLVHSNRNEPETNSGSDRKPLNLPRLPKNSDTVEPAPYTTLVVAPMSLLSQWASEAEAASKPGTLKTIIYYGADKSLDLRTQCSAANAHNAPNIIITSYGVVLSEFTQIANSANGSRGNPGGLFSVQFFRIILDEAHNIKNRQSKTAKACYELDAIHRWVLTGTPIVNRLEDLFSLVRFLRVEPWSNFAFWRTFITVPFESKDFLRALDVVQTVLEPLVMRRTKDMKQPDGTPLVFLPPKTIIIEEIELSKAERAVYDFIYMYVKRSFAENMEAGSVMKSYTTIFAQILRLRQSCCHPTLVRKKEIVADEVEADAAEAEAKGLTDNIDLQALIEKFTSQENDNGEFNNYNAHMLQQIKEEAENECPICSDEPIEEMTVTACFHMACKKCLLRLIEHAKGRNEQARCFNCREPINEKELYEVVKHEPEEVPVGVAAAFKDPTSAAAPEFTLRRIAAGKSSAKIDALIGNLKRLRREHPGMKSVVFSQFTSFISLIEPALARERIQSLRFDGAMSQQQRAAVLARFKSHVGGLVLLISLKAGGVGLNLTEAKRVFMMDPWWSFAVESQAIDRIHRMGQTEEVVVHRFVVKGSVEERMVHKIQERKKFIASSLGMMSAEEKRAQRIEDIKDLLS